MRFEDVVKKINKKWGEEYTTLYTGDNIADCEMFSTGSLGADYALYGGLPLGMIISFSGVEHSGKSLASALAISCYQKKFPHKMCLYIDAEHTLVSQRDFFVKMTGLNLKQLYVYDTIGKSADEVYEDILALQQSENIGLIVLDSVASLIPRADLDNDFTKDNGMRGNIANTTIKFLRQMVNELPKKQNSLILINQVSEKPLPTGAIQYVEPGGRGIRFFPAVKVRFGKRTYTCGDKTDISASKASADIDGFRLVFTITKSRQGKTDRGGGYITFRYKDGVDKVFDTVEAAIAFGFIDRPNLQTYRLINPETGEVLDGGYGKPCEFRGKNSLFSFLNDNPQFTQDYVNMLSDFINKSGRTANLLDEAELAKILDEENSVA